MSYPAISSKQSISYTVAPSPNKSHFTVTNQKKPEYVVSEDWIEWNIPGISSLSHLMESELSKFTFFVYSPENALQCSLWVFQSIHKDALPKIARAQENVFKARNLENTDKSQAILEYKKALDSPLLKGSTHPEVKNFFRGIKKACFFTQMKYEGDLYLTEENDIKEFNENISDYEKYRPEEVITTFKGLISNDGKIKNNSTYQLLTKAIVHENLDHPLLAVEAYLQLLSKEIKNSNSCIKKIETIIEKEKEKENDQFFDFLEKLDRNLLTTLSCKLNFLEQLLSQKDSIRKCFEESLSSINNEKSIREKPSCFVCFALENDVTNWLNQTFVPDMKRVGIEPIFGPWHLSHGYDLNNFQSKIRNTDLALVVCTPRLKEVCAARVDAITGCAQEIRVCLERYNDGDKSGTLFTMLLNGERKDCIPAPILEPIFATKLEVIGEKEHTYYSKIFRLFAAMKGIENPSNYADELNKIFLEKARKIISVESNGKGVGQQAGTSQNNSSLVEKSLSNHYSAFERKSISASEPTNELSRKTECRSSEDVPENLLPSRADLRETPNTKSKTSPEDPAPSFSQQIWISIKKAGTILFQAILLPIKILLLYAIAFQVYKRFYKNKL